jgi:hypothetical protein
MERMGRQPAHQTRHCRPPAPVTGGEGLLGTLSPSASVPSAATALAGPAKRSAGRISRDASSTTALAIVSCG